MPVLLPDHAERRSLLLLRRLAGREAGRQVDDHHVGVCQIKKKKVLNMEPYKHNMLSARGRKREKERKRERGGVAGLCRTCALLGEAAGVAQQLEGPLEAGRVLRGSVRGFDVGDEGAHLPLGLAGGRRQQALVALVERTGANHLAH